MDVAFSFYFYYFFLASVCVGQKLCCLVGVRHVGVAKMGDKKGQELWTELEAN